MKPVGMDESVADRLFDGMVEVDHKGHITFWNGSAERITGYKGASILGKHFQEQPARHISEAGGILPNVLVPLLTTAEDGKLRESLTHIDHADGYRLTVLVRTAPIYDKRRKLAGAVEIFTDNKALIAAFRANQRTEETVLFDPLTGIGNRPHIETKIRTALEDCCHQGGEFGILFIDIDHFKEFNDKYGHLLGDKVLRITANTLRQNLRGSDSCGRWGGEEFIALVHDLDPTGLETVAEKLRETVSQTRLSENGTALGITVSIGACLARPDDTVQSLIGRADRLMYESKRLGRNRVMTDC